VSLAACLLYAEKIFTVHASVLYTCFECVQQREFDIPCISSSVIKNKQGDEICESTCGEHTLVSEKAVWQ